MSVTRIRPTLHRHPNFRHRHFRPGTWATHTMRAGGRYRIADDSLARYEAYVGVDDDPDLTASPDATSATLPFAVSITPPGSGTDELQVVVLQRNKYNLASLNQYPRTIVVNSSGEQVDHEPTAPTNIELINTSGGHVEARAVYWTTQDADPADTWVLYVTSNGTDPDPGVDVPSTEAFTANPGLFPRKRFLRYTLGPYSLAATIKAIVRVRRSSDSAESDNVTVVSTTVTTPQTPTPAGGSAFQGEGAEWK